MGRRAAAVVANALRTAINTHGRACLVVATGASQFTVLSALVEATDVDWSRVTGFHLDEYLALSADHPASFRRYLRERFVELVPQIQFHYVNGEIDPKGECQRLGRLLQAHPIDVACVGVGENGHLAFNDPPADFITKEPFIIVELDEACRRQQLGEGWFASLEDVPRQAISMSIRQIMDSRIIVCSVPGSRKAKAVKATVEGPVTADCPASILQKHPQATLLLDRDSAHLLRRD